MTENTKRIMIFDTTLRDGEQAPGCSMNLKEKLEVARQLEVLGVDVIEAGFAIASPGDFNSVRAVAKECKNVTVASLSRAVTKDIDAAWEAVRLAKRPRIHTFIATSDIHMQYKLRMTPEQVLQQTADMVSYARKLCGEVEFSAEDASRSDREFLCRVFETAIKAGAAVINIPDTVGYASSEEFSGLIAYVKKNTPNIDKAHISVHCHNDLGLAVSNSLAAVLAGADQIECTVNGIGERAGNAALEEIVMNLRTRPDYYKTVTGVDTTQLTRASRLVSSVTGMRVQANKAIVGANAFAHEAGIHQHGVLANRSTYEIMTPESVGLIDNNIVLGKHSGHHAFETRLEQLGYHVTREQSKELFAEFKQLADRKKTVTDRDIDALVRSLNLLGEQYYKLDRFVINAGNTITNTSTVRLLADGQPKEAVATGDGPVDASYKAIDKIVGQSFKLEDYAIQSVTGGHDAQGEVSVRISSNGETYHGSGLSTDIIQASILAYIDAINTMMSITQADMALAEGAQGEQVLE